MAGRTWRNRGDKFLKFQNEVEQKTGFWPLEVHSGATVQVYVNYTVPDPEMRYSHGLKTIKAELFSFDQGYTHLEEKRIEKYGTPTPSGDDIARSMGYDIKMTNRSGGTIYTTPESMKTSTEVKARAENIPIDLALEKRLSEQKVTNLDGKPFTPLEMKKKIKDSIDAAEHKTEGLTNKMMKLPIMIIVSLIILVFLIFGISRRY